MDFISFVPNSQVRFVEVFIKPNDGSLDGEVVLMDGTKQKGPQVFGAAKLKEFPGVRQFANGTLHFLEAAMEPGFQLTQWDVRQMAVVENSKRQAKLGPELLKGHLRALGLG